MSRPRRLSSVVTATILAAAIVPLLATPVGATNVATAAEFRAAWSNASETLITLTANITLDCESSPTRNSSTAIVIEGGGFTLDNPCPGLTALVSDGDGAVTIRNLTVSGDTTTATGLDIDGDLTVEGSTVTGHGGHGIELDTDGADLTLTSSTVSNNGLDDSGDGDGINMRISTATITGSTITGNQEDGLETEGPVTVTNSTISNNLDENGIVAEGDVSVTGSTISGNGVGDFSCGDGVETEGADDDVTVVNSTISGNADAGINAGGEVSVTGSTVADNGPDAECEAAGVLSVFRNASVDRSTVEGNAGVGVLATDTTVTSSTVADNGADFTASGVVAVDDATVTGSTVTGNAGHGVTANDVATVTNSTIADNGAAGVASFVDVVATHATITGNAVNVSTLSLDTIHLFATVLLDPGVANCVGVVVDEGHNFVDDASCVGIAANAADPQLGALANNGGPPAPVTPTLTRLPADTSPLLDVVPDADCDLTTDQRGLPRPAGANCDVGAVEVQLPAASINDVSVLEGNAGTVDATFSVTLSRAAGETVTIGFATANGTATQPGDYQSATGTLTFAPGDVSEAVTVRVVGDTLDEANETFVVNLSGPTNATIADPQGTGTIVDDEGPIVTPTPASQLPNTATTLFGSTLAGPAAVVALLVVLASGSALIRRHRRG